MTNHRNTIGFVFKKEDRSEADRIFSIFTDDFGSLKIFAKAIRKITSKLKSGIDIFSVSEIEFIQGKNKKTLTDAVFIKRFDNIAISPKRFKIASQVTKVLDDFLREQEPDKNIFNLLIDVFDKLNGVYLKEKDCILVYYYFFWNFCFIIGFRPELQKCAGCHCELNPEKVYFSSKDGGAICQNCYNLKKQVIKINSDTIKILRLILKRDWQTISKLKFDLSSQKLLQQVTDNYCAYLLDK
jgi:DNA repair protein RecO (recombination protein O)